MIDKKIFKTALAKVFHEAGFSHRGRSWFLAGQDSIVVIGLQKSDYDEKYYINFGIWLKRFGSTDQPKENQCHIQTRLTSLFPNHASLVEEACSLDKASVARLGELIDIVHSELIPFCLTCLTEKDLRGLIIGERFKKALILKIAKDVLLSSS